MKRIFTVRIKNRAERWIVLSVKDPNKGLGYESFLPNIYKLQQPITGEIRKIPADKLEDFKYI